ncbi:hypothetical protein [Streptomyces sp. WAC05950]|uniref:hypothetical protein n=1 Tax=Streptomyces sp. WAC05950 TaxID=2487419 RepID=UPI000F742C42|nr:hypothetical protein [Streptomyces sp. WAC05950]RST13467.1 hypothetical protein EF904_07230 [Streptomyces sp. WAC05950]
MNVSIHCPVSLTPAPDGWWVQHTSPDGSKFQSRIVAWAVVTTGNSSDDEGMSTTVQPVFVEHGHLWTVSEWYGAMGTDCDVVVVEP